MGKNDICGYDFEIRKVRLYPNDEQAEKIRKNIGCSRVIYNQSLREREMVYNRYLDYYNGDTKRASKAALEYKYFTESQYKNDINDEMGMKYLSFLKEADSVALQQSRIHLNNAYRNFFKGQNGSYKQKYGKPKIKSKHPRYAGKYTTVNGVNIDQNSRKIHLPKIGWIKYRDKTFLPNFGKGVRLPYSTSTVHYTPSGEFYISLKIDLEPKKSNYKKNIHYTQIPLDELRIESLDFSFKDFGYVNQKGEIVTFPAFLKKKLDKLAFLNKKISKKRESYKKMNKNRSDDNKIWYNDTERYKKLSKKIASLYQDISNNRNAFLEDESNRLLKNNDIIIIEKLNMKAFAKGKHGKKVQDMAWGEFVRKLEYKADRQNKLVIKVPWNYPSSKLCSNCGYKYTKLTIDIREWTCPDCGACHDRDKNAAINLINYFIKNIENYFPQIKKIRNWQQKVEELKLRSLK